MSDLYWLTDEQMERLRPFFPRSHDPKSHDRPRVDGRRVLGGIIFVNRNGLRWRDAPKDYGPAKTLTNRGSVGTRRTSSSKWWRDWPPRAPSGKRS